MKINNETAIKIIDELGNRLGNNLLNELEEYLDDDKKHYHAKSLLTKSLIIDSIIRYNQSTNGDITYDSAHKEYINNYSDVADGPWPPWAVLWDVYEKFKTVKGKELVDFVEYQTRTIDQISKADDDTIMAVEMEKSHILGFGMDDGKVAFNEYISLLQNQKNINSSILTTSSNGKPNKLLLKAIKKGIKITGRKNIYITIALILASLLLWLAMGNKKQVLGMVANATEDDLYTRNWEGEDGGISDVYMNTGKMKSYMSGYYPPEWDKNLAIPYSYIDDDEIEKSIIWCGGFFMEKKFGFYGTEGIFLLHNEDKSLVVATLGACPYSHDNRTWIQGVDDIDKLDSSESKETLLLEMYEHNKIERSIKYKGYTLYTQLGSKSTKSESGGETAMCVYIEEGLNS
ncbi:hypothetical protein [Photobacterium sp. OFAV2-7]|uniref:hypothetical protein n=1 Tax=Photobacterium sp. OFAV2-7 TaxID=2917748 RepID=UPI001EF6D302|nr:hypothetical protein [Photobacterium sp. OFAV2-7]MCG7588362.1 hypothetical protein [Photobacterium sp. OFAV2-7]